jgi:hypothetical protein
MNFERRDVFQAASRGARKAKRASGRLLVSALGFALAYYFDSANGSARRQRLRGQLRAAARGIDGMFTADRTVEDAPPVFYPLLQSPPKRPTILPKPQSKTG